MNELASSLFSELDKLRSDLSARIQALEKKLDEKTKKLDEEKKERRCERDSSNARIQDLETNAQNLNGRDALYRITEGLRAQHAEPLHDESDWVAMYKTVLGLNDDEARALNAIGRTFAFRRNSCEVHRVFDSQDTAIVEDMIRGFRDGRALRGSDKFRLALGISTTSASAQLRHRALEKLIEWAKREAGDSEGVSGSGSGSGGGSEGGDGCRSGRPFKRGRPQAAGEGKKAPKEEL